MTKSALKIRPKHIFSSAVILCGIAAFYLTCPPDGKPDTEKQPLPVLEKLIVHEKPKDITAFNLEQNGGIVRLNDYRGSVVVLNYWATWCAPCRVEMPTLKALQDHYAAAPPSRVPNRVQIVTVSTDRGKIDKPRAFLEEVGAQSLTLWHDPKGISAHALGAYGLPTTLIIDQAGKEVARLLGEADWNSRAIHRFIDGLLRSAERDSKN